MPEGEEVRSIPGQNVSPGAQGLEVKKSSPLPAEGEVFPLTFRFKEQGFA
jgi:hypothetical protein